MKLIKLKEKNGFVLGRIEDGTEIFYAIQDKLTGEIQASTCSLKGAEEEFEKLAGIKMH